MKTSKNKGVLLFGDLVAAIFRACGKRKAKDLVRVAVNQRLIVFPGQQRYVISEE